ncbi:MAG: PEP-CTERM sorting domain-containing protein [Chthonomonadetes bacterium]|nr:PEP-CTERM sorting domain-containing protein [Chthonomonadetes bacterium]
MNAPMQWFRAVMLALLVSGVILASVPVSADDLAPPPWRGAPGSDWQHWTWDNGPNAVPDFWNNPYGTPTENTSARQNAAWNPIFGGRTGVWELEDGYMEWYIPDHFDPQLEKLVRVQLTLNVPDWNWAGSPTIGPVTDLGDGWYHHWADYVIPCQPFTVWIAGTFAIDQMVVDSVCVPEPGTMLLSAIGFGVVGAALRRRRKA